MKLKLHKVLNIYISLSLLVNSIYAPLSVYAQEITPSPEPTPIVEESPSPEPSVLPTEESIVSPTPSEEPTISSSGTPISESTGTPIPIETFGEGVIAEPSAEILFTPKPEIEKVCLTDETIKDTENSDWNISDAGGYAETKEKVTLGVKYNFPQENKVSVTFKCLPKDESLRTTLKIQKVKVSDLKLADGINPYGEYAYDITTGMNNGDFEYDITLPKPDNTPAEVSYMEDKSGELKVVEEEKTKQEGSVVKVESLDHFTIFIVMNPDETLVDDGVNNEDNGWVSDNNYATFNNSDDHAEYGFPSLGIPSGSTIEGIEVFIEGKTTGRDFDISLWNKSNSNPDAYTATKLADLGSTESTVTLGGSTEKWGKTWIDTDFDTNFKIKVDANSGSGTTAYLDMVQVKVYYTAPIIVSNPSLSQTCGLDIALVIDSSGSIGSNMTTMKNAFKSFVDALSGTPTQFSVTEFDTNSYTPLDFTSDVNAIKSAIDGAFAGGGTNWKEGIATARGTFDPRTNKPNLIIFASDGNPTFPSCGGSSSCQADVDAAVIEANIAKSLPLSIRMLVLGITGDQGLNTDNLKAISGPNMNTGDVLTSDVITTDFNGLATQLANFAKATCGGTITVNKYIGSVSESTRGNTGWDFNIAGTSKTTDSNGQTDAVAVTAGSGYSVTETNLNQWPGYTFSSATCKKQDGSLVGSSITNGVGSIAIGDQDIISCNFVNTAPSSTINWPPTWETPNSCISDPANDENPGSTDLIGDTGNPAVGFATDSSFAYFRERVNGNPAGSGGYDQYAWVVLFQTSKPQYQFLASLNGKDEKIQLWQNTSPAGAVDFSPLLNDPAETKLWEVDAYQYSRIVSNSDGSYFVDWAIPLSVLSAHGINPSVTKFFATSANENNYNKDHLNCYNELCDVAITKTDSKDPVNKGETFSYTLTVSNIGADTAQNVIVTDTLPSGFTLTSVSSSQGSCTGFPCNLGSIVSGGSATITIIGIANQVGTLTNSASVSSSTLDIDTSNNSDSEDTVVNEVKGTLKVIKHVSGGLSSADDWTMQISNPTGSFGSFPGSETGVDTSLTAGTYNVTESGGPTDYSLSYSTNCPDGVAEVIAGQTTTCTLTNTRDTGRIKIYKYVNPVGSVWHFDLTSEDGQDYDAGGYDLGSGNYGTILAATGNHTLTESPSSGVGTSDVFDSSYRCAVLPYNYSGSINFTITGQGRSVPLTVEKDKEIWCEFYNIERGHLLVTKVVNPISNLTPFTINVTSSTSGSITGDSTRTILGGETENFEVTSGTYSVSENSLAGWYPQYACQNIVINPGETKTCTINNTKYGSITVVKNSVPDDSEDFNFLVNSINTGYSSGNIVLDDDGNNTTNPKNTELLTDLLPGVYSISESVNPTDNWDLTNLSCLSDTGNQFPIWDGSNSTVFDLGAGENVTCTFTNTKRGSITITKDVVPNDSSVWDFGISNPATGEVYPKNDLGDGQFYTFNNLISGTWSISEVADSKYTTTVTCGGVGPLTQNSFLGTVSPGQDLACTFTNTRKTGNIQFLKSVSGGTSVPSDWEFTIGGGNGTAKSGDTKTYPTGNYTITESGPAGYSRTGISGTACSVVGGVINLNVTENGGTCTIFNTRDTGSITLDKITDPSEDTQEFTFHVVQIDNNSWNGATQHFNPLPGGFSQIVNIADLTTPPVITVPTGNYDLYEDVLGGWTQSNYICNYTTGVRTGGGIMNYNFDIRANENATCTYTNTKLGSISGYKWEDMNGNGTQDAEDLPISGWTIKLDKDADGNVDQITTTDINGVYTFTNLLPGTYKVFENTPSPWNVSHPSLGINYYNGIVVTAGANLSGYDFGNYKNGRIEGLKWEDMNGNGIKDAGETAPANQWEIKLWKDDGNGTPVDTGSTAYTQTGGLFSFGFAPGTYYLSEVSQPGWTKIYPNTDFLGPIVVTSGSLSQNNNFGNFKLGSISGQKFSDLNGNGVKDTGEPGLPGWTIQLYKSEVNGLTIFASAVTDTNGNYTSVNLGPGQYRLFEVNQPGWAQTMPFSYYDVLVASGQDVTGMDFGNQQFGRIIIEKQTTPNTDSTTEFGFTVSYNSSFPLLKNMDTNDSGWLTPGTYTVTELVKTGWDISNLACSDPNGDTAINGMTANINLDPGEEIHCTFDNTQRGLITSHKFADFDKNGLQDAGEPNVQYFQMSLYQGNSCSGFPVSQLDTDSNGNAVFGNLIEGDYSIKETLPPAGLPGLGWWTNISPLCQDVHVNPGQNEQVNFANFKVGELTVCKSNDVNGDGIWQPGDNRLSGWTINLTGPENLSGITGGDGCVRIPINIYGGYEVTEVLMPGWMQTFPSEPQTGYVTYNMSSGLQLYNFQLGKISGKKFNDLNGNGNQDSGELGLAGWTINLDKNADGLVDSTTITDVNGDYSFTGLLAGIYRVREVSQAGWVQKSTNPNDVQIVSGSDTAGVDFGNIHYGSIALGKCNDINGDGGECDGSEPMLAGWTLFLDENGNHILDNEERSGITNSEGMVYFTNVLPRAYGLCEVEQEGWIRTKLSDSNCIDVNLAPGGGLAFYFANQEIDLGLTLAKSNSVSGSTVNYSLTLTNTGNQDLTEIVVTDALPGGFSYVLGSSKVDGVAISDPIVVGGAMIWSIPDGLLKGTENSKILTYKANISSDLKNGIYTNLAYALGTFRYGREYSESKESRVSTSDVAISLGIAYSGTLLPQVLGASTELPGTGNPTIMLVIAILMGLIGVSVKIHERKGKNAKN